MNSNFDFFRRKWNELYQVARFAEKKVYTDPNSALIKLRLFGELFLKYVSASEGLNEPYIMNQKARMELLHKEKVITLEVFEMLDTIRIKGNKAVHEPNYGSKDEAKRMLKLAFFLGGWLIQIYEKWDYELPEFTDPELVNVTSKESIKPNSQSNSKGTNSIRATIMTFLNNDIGYKLWLDNNKQGFVFNHFGGGEASREMNKIHNASCRYLYRTQDEGKRTTTFPKICSTSLEELVTHVTNMRGTSWVFCKNCMNE